MRSNIYLIFFSILLIAGVSWLLLPAPVEKEQDSFVLKTKINGLKKRKILNLKHIGTITLDKKAINFKISETSDLFFIPFEKTPDNYITKIQGNEKTFLDLIPSGKLYRHLYHDRDQLITSFASDDGKLTVRLDKKSKSSTYPTQLSFDYTSELDDSCIYQITANNHNDSYYLSKYNFFKSVFVDSISLNKIFEINAHDLNLILFGRLLVDDNFLIYKSIYSSEIVKFNKHNLSIYERKKSIDSLPLPKIKIHKMAEGVQEALIEPLIFPSFQFEKMGDRYSILSRTGIKRFTSYLDIYSKQFEYIASFEIPNINVHTNAYAYKFTLDSKTLYILFDDYLTVFKYEIAWP